MFKVGDKVVYGLTGVCEITDICEKELIRKSRREYYVLKPFFEQNNVIYAPIDNDKLFIRKLITKQEADDLISKIPDIVNEIDYEIANAEDYRKELEAHKNESLVKLTALIYEKKLVAHSNKKRLNSSDEKFMRIAEHLLFGELSVALGIEYDAVEDYIKQRLEK